MTIYGRIALRAFGLSRKSCAGGFATVKRQRYSPLYRQHELYVPELLIPVSFLIGLCRSVRKIKGARISVPLCIVYVFSETICLATVPWICPGTCFGVSAVPVLVLAGVPAVDAGTSVPGGVPGADVGTSAPAVVFAGHA